MTYEYVNPNSRHRRRPFAQLRLLLLALVLVGLSACDAMDPGTGELEAEEQALASQIDGSAKKGPSPALVPCSESDWYSRPGTTLECGYTYADFDGDGRQEIFKRTADGKWMLAESVLDAGTQIGSSAYPFSSLGFGDFDADGKTDIFYANLAAKKWYVSYGGRTTWTPINNSGIYYKYLAFGDFNGDGKTDVFRAAPSSNAWYVSWGGTSNWKQMNTQSAPLEDLAFGDFNGDGKTDVFRTDPVDGRFFISWDGRARFTVLNNQVGSNLLSDLHFADVNNDGKMDVLRLRGSRYMVSYGGRTAWEPAPPFDEQQSIRGGDLDGDSKPDSYGGIL